MINAVEQWLDDRHRYSTFGFTADTTDPKERRLYAEHFTQLFNDFIEWRDDDPAD